MKKLVNKWIFRNLILLVEKFLDKKLDELDSKLSNAIDKKVSSESHRLRLEYCNMYLQKLSNLDDRVVDIKDKLKYLDKLVSQPPIITDEFIVKIIDEINKRQLIK
jgi:hypothetical protein